MISTYLYLRVVGYLRYLTHRYLSSGLVWSGLVWSGDSGLVSLVSKSVPETGLCQRRQAGRQAGRYLLVSSTVVISICGVM